jgi:hypothetical protein
MSHCVATCYPNDCRFLLEKLTGSQLVEKFHAFYGTRRFIIAYTRARYLSLSWARSSSPCPHPTSRISILILSSHLRLVIQLVSVPQVIPPKPCILLYSRRPNIIVIIIIIFCVAVSLSIGYTPTLPCFSELCVFLCHSTRNCKQKIISDFTLMILNVV